MYINDSFIKFDKQWMCLLSMLLLWAMCSNIWVRIERLKYPFHLFNSLVAYQVTYAVFVSSL